MIRRQGAGNRAKPPAREVSQRRLAKRALLAQADRRGHGKSFSYRIMEADHGSSTSALANVAGVSDATWVAADGRRRCGWLPRDEADFSYHDEVWGTPTRDERALFEALSLGLFEIGMSWSVVFRKRHAFLEAFDNFQPAKIAAYADDDVRRLLSDSAIVRNRRKITAVISNARVVGPMSPSLAELVWSFAPPDHQPPASWAAAPVTSDEAKGLSAAMKRVGLTMVGPVSIYAFMQSTGVVNDHIQGCFRALT